MSSKRGRKRNDNLPPNRARDVQRAFRARRAAHLKALEDRVSELEEENGCLRQALNLPPSNRPPLGKGPTGKDKPKTFESTLQSFGVSSSRELSSAPTAAPSPVSRASSESPSNTAVSMSSLSSRPMTVIESGTWNDSILLSDPPSHQTQSQPGQVSPIPQQQQQQQQQQHPPAQPPVPTPPSVQPQHQQISQQHHHRPPSSTQQAHQGLHHSSLDTQGEITYHITPLTAPLSAPLPMKPLQFASYSDNFASTSRPLSSALYSSSSPSYSQTSDRPLSTGFGNQTYNRTDHLRQEATNRHQQYSYQSSFQPHNGSLHSQTPSPGIAHLHNNQNNTHTPNARDLPLPYPHRRSLTDPQGFSLGQGFPHLPNPTQLQSHPRPPEYIRPSESFHLTTSRPGIYGSDGRLHIP
ncbi:hypothetical protein CVT24_002173 [Panaeolus cyanescens]|uniref:BZIP domain-containing protein n=1 Tax=Panaeolus cyanescens TaxID=181874 RepID=A0A409YHY9_9AGAR|nr:hypothetical protein CVT24_002173 [Panaeolus cyanescens]